MSKNFIGDNIAYCLRRKSKTQKWLADECGVTKGQINHIIHGKSSPSLGLVFGISRALNIDVNVLVQSNSSDND